MYRRCSKVKGVNGFFTGKKGQKKEEKEEPRDAAASSSVKALQRKLAAAEAEAERLKRQLEEQGSSKRRKIDPEAAASAVNDVSPDMAVSEENTEKVLNHKERKRLQRAAYKNAKREQLKKVKQNLRKEQKKSQKDAAKASASTANAQTVGQLEAEEEPPGDTAAWKPYELDPLIEAALSKMQFTAPTPIQQECLPAAIRDRRDVIGAAQTVTPRPVFAQN